MTDYHIPEPCHEDWADMTPAERGRHCAVCDKTVVDLTACSPREGRALLERTRVAAGSTGVCARVRVDARKRVRFGGFRRHVLTNGLALLLTAGAAAGCAESGTEVALGGIRPVAPVDPAPAPAPQPPKIMGEIQALSEPEPEPELMGDIVAVPQPVEPQPVPPVMGRIAVAPPPACELPETGTDAPPPAE